MSKAGACRFSCPYMLTIHITFSFITGVVIFRSVKLMPNVVRWDKVMKQQLLHFIVCQTVAAQSSLPFFSGDKIWRSFCNIHYLEFTTCRRDLVKQMRLDEKHWAIPQREDANISCSNFRILKIETRFIKYTTQLYLYLLHINFPYRYFYELPH